MKTLFAGIILIAFGLMSLPPIIVMAEETTFDQPPKVIGGYETVLSKAIYPEKAKKDGIEGKVLVSAQVKVDGSTGAVSIVEGVRDDLNRAALEAVQGIRWEPAVKDGKPVECTVVVPIQFKLEDKKPKK